MPKSCTKEKDIALVLFGNSGPDQAKLLHRPLSLTWAEMQNVIRALQRPSTKSVLELTPRRSLLYVPGDSERKIKKAAVETDADCVCMDMEDAVAHNRKAVARDTIVAALATMGFGRSERAVRINSADTPYVEDDLRAVLTGQQLPDALVVPKVDSSDHVAWLFAKVRDLAAGRLHPSKPPLALITMCESGLGLLNLRDIFESCRSQQERFGGLRLEACIFGADDYMACLGLKRQQGSEDTLFARRWVALHARSYGLQPIDQVFIDFKNEHGLTLECEQGRTLGFAGKQVIHPAQVPITQRAFSPDPHDVQEARELVEAFDEHQRQGLGAFVFKDKMIDNPTYEQAKNLIQFAERIKQC